MYRVISLGGTHLKMGYGYVPPLRPGNLVSPYFRSFGPHTHTKMKVEYPRIISISQMYSHDDKLK